MNNYKFEIYKGIGINSFNTFDERIKCFIDSLSEEDRENLSSLSYKKGSLGLEWNYNLKIEYPNEYDIDATSIDMGVDCWNAINTFLHSTKKVYYVEKDISRVISRDKRFKVLKRQKWRCNFCNCSLKFDKNSKWDGAIAHIDHIHPYSKRDTYPNGEENINELANLQGLCERCNLKKGKREIN